MNYEAEVKKRWPDAYCSGPMKAGAPYCGGGYFVFESLSACGPIGWGQTREESWQSVYESMTGGAE